MTYCLGRVDRRVRVKAVDCTLCAPMAETMDFDHPSDGAALPAADRPATVALSRWRDLDGRSGSRAERTVRVTLLWNAIVDFLAAFHLAGRSLFHVTAQSLLI